MQFPWERLDHIGILLTLGSAVFWVWRTAKKKWEENAAYRWKTDVMWRDHGYGEWDGTERRNERR